MKNAIGAAAMALGAGAAGGYVASLLNWPLAWMLGSLLANLTLVFLGAKPGAPAFLRRFVLAVIGVYLGAAFTPAAFANVGGIVLSLLWMALYVAAVIFCARHLFLRLLPINRRATICAAIPGALALTIAMAEEKGAALPVTIIQTMRLVMIIITLPLLARFFLGDAGGGADGNDAVGQMPAVAIGAQNSLALAALVLPPAVTGTLLKWRAPTILAAAVALSAGVHIGGGDLPPLPSAPINLALVLLGAFLGCSFLAFRDAPMWRIFAVGAFVNALMIGLAAVFAAVGAPLLGVPFWTLLLSLAPGGISEISLIALALDINPTYVTLHQVARIIGLVLLMPPLVALIERLEKPGNEKRG